MHTGQIYRTKLVAQTQRWTAATSSYDHMFIISINIGLKPKSTTLIPGSSIRHAWPYCSLPVLISQNNSQAAFLFHTPTRSFHQSERSKYESGFIFTYVGIYGDITTKAINNVNNRGNVKKLHIGHKAKQNRKNARRPITVAVGMAAGANISHLSSTLAISFTQKDR